MGPNSGRRTLVVDVAYDTLIFLELSIAKSFA